MEKKDIESLRKKSAHYGEFSQNTKISITSNEINKLVRGIKRQISLNNDIAVIVLKIKQK